MSQPSQEIKVVSRSAVHDLIEKVRHPATRKFLLRGMARIVSHPISFSTTPVHLRMIEHLEGQLGIHNSSDLPQQRTNKVIAAVRELQQSRAPLERKPYGRGEEIAEAVKIALEAVGLNLNSISMAQRKQIIHDLRRKGLTTNDEERNPWLEK